MKGPFFILSFNRDPRTRPAFVELQRIQTHWRFVQSGSNADGTPRFHLCQRITGSHLWDLSYMEKMRVDLGASDLLLVNSVSSFVNQVGKHPSEVFLP